MGKNYPIDRDKRGRYRHSFVFVRGVEVSVKLFNRVDLLKGKVTTIERYYFVLAMEEEGKTYQITINFSEVKYIKHDVFPTVQERSPKGNLENTKTSFVFNLGEQLVCVFKDGKIVKGELLSENAYYVYIRTDKGSFLTVMKGALNYIRHKKHKPMLLVDDFYTEEMRDGGYSKPTEYVFDVGDTITVVFTNGKELSGVVTDERKYWLLLTMKDKQVTIMKESYAYIKHAVYPTKANLYVDNKRLRKNLRK